MGPDSAEQLVDALLDAHAVSIEEHRYSALEVIENDCRMSRLRAEIITAVRGGLLAQAAGKGGG